MDTNNCLCSVFCVVFTQVRLCRVSWDLDAQPKLSLLGSKLPVNDFLQFQFVYVCGEWGMLRVVFNIEAGNYYSKSTFIMILIKQEKLVFILVISYIWSIYVLCLFTKLFTGTWVSEAFQFLVSDSSLIPWVPSIDINILS